MSKDTVAAATNDRSKITLDTPIQRGSQTVDEVQLRRPAAGELRGLKLTDVIALDVNAMQVLLPRITAPSLTSQEVAALTLPDLLQFGVGVSSFFEMKATLEA